MVMVLFAAGVGQGRLSQTQAKHKPDQDKNHQSQSIWLEQPERFHA
jgi:hypothetical protein